VNRPAPSKANSQPRRSPAQIAQLLDEYRQSGKSQREFAEAHQVPLSSLVYWLGRERLRQSSEPSGPGERAPDWVEAVAAPPPDSASQPQATQNRPFQLQWPNGVRLRVPADFDAAALRRLLKALEPTVRP
jgi:hypothetical protein